MRFFALLTLTFFSTLSMAEESAAPAHGGGLIGRIDRQAIDIQRVADSVNTHSDDLKTLMSSMISDRRDSIARERESLLEIQKKLEATKRKEGAEYVVVSAGALSLIATVTAAAKSRPYAGKAAYLTSTGVLSTITSAGGGYQIYLTRAERDALQKNLTAASGRITEKEELLAKLEAKFNERYGKSE